MSACGGDAPRARGVEAAGHHAPTAATTAPAMAEPGPLPGAVEVVPPESEALPYALLPIEEEDAVLAVSQALGGEPTVAQRFDGVTRKLDPPLYVPGFPAAAFATAGKPPLALLTAGTGLGIAELGPGRLGEVSWETGPRPDAVVRVAGRFLTLSLAAPPSDEDDAPAKKPARKTRKKSRERPKNGRARHEATAPARRELALFAHWFGETAEERRARAPSADEEAEDPFDTGVRIEEPMAGLGIVGAGVRTLRGGGPRVDVVFHEWAGDKGTVADGALGRARFGVVGLDPRGEEVEGSRGHLSDGDLFFGFLAGQVLPRLETFAGGSVLLSQSSPRGTCQADLVTPARAPMGPSRRACALDPGRLLAAAEQRRRPETDPQAKQAAAAVEKAFEAAAARLLAEGAHRAEWQPGRDGPLAALGPQRGFTQLASGALWSFDRATFELREEPRPLIVQRARAFAAAIAADGEALVRTHDGLRLVRVDGTVERIADPFAPGGPRRDEVVGAPAPFAKIGASWWTSRGAPQRLVPPASTPRSPGSQEHPQAAVLVGGEANGLLLELDGAALVVSTLDAEGRLRRASRSTSPVVAPIDAVALETGGALVVGRRRGGAGRWVAFAVDAGGHLGSPRAELDPGYGPVVRLAAVPGRGAVALAPDKREATWLDAEGNALGTANLKEPNLSGCVDGAHLPRDDREQAVWPDRGPGSLRTLPALDDEGACAVGLPVVGRDGALRLVISRRVGANASVELLKVPGDAPAPGRSAGAPAPAAPPASGPAPGAPRCAPEMVLVDGRFCVDRWESAIAESTSGRLASPDYPITPNLFAAVLGDWATGRERVGGAIARALPLPRPAPFQFDGVTAPIAVSRAGILPSGYLTGLVAREVCASAGKRLCTKEEFRTACRGEKGTRFPYGERYQDGACNVGRGGHPAAVLHDHASLGHLDPRLGRVMLDDRIGLQPTGAHEACASRWGGDAIYDMVGNLDEWLDVKGGAFAGGFYARRTTSGCDALVDNHPEGYLDYSTGVRCCATARGGER